MCQLGGEPPWTQSFRHKSLRTKQQSIDLSIVVTTTTLIRSQSGHPVHLPSVHRITKPEPSAWRHHENGLFHLTLVMFDILMARFVSICAIYPPGEMKPVHCTKSDQETRGDRYRSTLQSGSEGRTVPTGKANEQASGSRSERSCPGFRRGGR